MSTFEIKFDPHGFWIANFNCLVPIAWDSFECFRLWPELLSLCRSRPFGFTTFFDLMGYQFSFIFQATFLGLM